MPYLTKKRREDVVSGTVADGLKAGDLNYLLTMDCLEYLSANKECYQTYNDIIGALESCKLEFYRRMVLPYENKKARENGDVY